MSTLIPPPPPTVPIGRTTDGRPVLIDNAWALYLTKGLLERLGGFEAPSNSELSVALHDDAGIEEMKADINQLRHESALTPPVIPSVAADPFDTAVLLNYALAELAELRKQVDALRAGTIL